jgi:hypothetical protein
MDFGPIQHIFRTASPSPLAWIFIIVSFFIFLGWAELRKKVINSRGKEAKNY